MHILKLFCFPCVGVLLGLNEHFCTILKLKCDERLSVTKRWSVIVLKMAQTHAVYDFGK